MTRIETDVLDIVYRPEQEALRLAYEAKAEVEKWRQLEKYHQYETSVANTRLSLAIEQFILRLAELDVAKAVTDEELK
jgi:hypothetical protein